MTCNSTIYSESTVLYTLQQWLHERATALRYTYFAYLVLFSIEIRVFLNAKAPFSVDFVEWEEDLHSGRTGEYDVERAVALVKRGSNQSRRTA